DQPNARRHENLHEMRTIAHRPDQKQITQIAEREKKESCRQKADIGIDPEKVEQHVGGIHAHHEKSAMGEINDAHDAKNQGQAHADQSIERSGQQSVSTGLKEAHQRVCDLLLCSKTASQPCAAFLYRLAQTGAGMMGLVSAASPEKTTR